MHTNRYPPTRPAPCKNAPRYDVRANQQDPAPTIPVTMDRCNRYLRMDRSTAIGDRDDIPPITRIATTKAAIPTGNSASQMIATPRFVIGTIAATMHAAPMTTNVRPFAFSATDHIGPKISRPRPARAGAARSPPSVSCGHLVAPFAGGQGDHVGTAMLAVRGVDASAATRDTDPFEAPRAADRKGSSWQIPMRSER
jgi:hypothetical protein